MTGIFISTVAQKGHVHYQLPILNFHIISFRFGYFSLSISNFLISDFQYAHFSLPNLASPLPIWTFPITNLDFSNFQF